MPFPSNIFPMGISVTSLLVVLVSAKYQMVVLSQTKQFCNMVQQQSDSITKCYETPETFTSLGAKLKLIASEENEGNNSTIVILVVLPNQILEHVVMATKSLNLFGLGLHETFPFKSKYPNSKFLHLSISSQWFSKIILDVYRRTSRWDHRQMTAILDDTTSHQELWFQLRKIQNFGRIVVIESFIQNMTKCIKNIQSVQSSVFLLYTRNQNINLWFETLYRVTPEKFKDAWIVIGWNGTRNPTKNSPKNAVFISSQVAYIDTVTSDLAEIISNFSLSINMKNLKLTHTIRKQLIDTIHTRFQPSFLVTVYMVTNSVVRRHLWHCSNVFTIIDTLSACLDEANSNRVPQSLVPIVMIPESPIVYVDSSIQPSIFPSGEMDCYHKIPCIVFHSAPRKLTVDIRDLYYEYMEFQLKSLGRYTESSFITKPIQSQLGNITFSVDCCSGLVVDIIQQLTRDLNFKVILYPPPDLEYGAQLEDNSWNGMVGELLTGQAALAVGAFSMTPKRSEVISFSNPFYSTGYAILVKDKIREAHIGAVFFSFYPSVWICIFITATVAAVAMGVLEWTSPFGLNPWGRRRLRNYTLASAFTSAFNILFNRTMRAKTPKSWPVKVLQNFWAAGCICIVASYTANLIAFIMETVLSTTFDDILKTSSGKIATFKDVAGTEIFLNLHPKFALRLLHVSSTKEGIECVANGSAIGFLDDRAILEHEVRNTVPHCNIRVEPANLGAAGYAIGIRKGYWRMESINDRILRYEQASFFEQLEKYYRQPTEKCNPSYRRVGFINMAGAFVALGAGLVVSMLLLLIELVWFKRYVAAWRRLPSTHFLKSIHFMFFSQRIYRIIHSEEVIGPRKHLYRSDETTVSKPRKQPTVGVFDVSAAYLREGCGIAKNRIETNDNKGFEFDHTAETNQMAAVQKSQQLQTSALIVNESDLFESEVTTTSYSDPDPIPLVREHSDCRQNVCKSDESVNKTISSEDTNGSLPLQTTTELAVLWKSSELKIQQKIDRLRHERKVLRDIMQSALEGAFNIEQSSENNILNHTNEETFL